MMIKKPNTKSFSLSFLDVSLPITRRNSTDEESDDV